MTSFFLQSRIVAMDITLHEGSALTVCIQHIDIYTMSNIQRTLCGHSITRTENTHDIRLAWHSLFARWRHMYTQDETPNEWQTRNIGT